MNNKMLGWKTTNLTYKKLIKVILITDYEI